MSSGLDPKETLCKCMLSKITAAEQSGLSQMREPRAEMSCGNLEKYSGKYEMCRVLKEELN